MKRIFDIVLATILIIVFSPVMIVAAIVVLLNFGSPIIFTQTRMGLDVEQFTIYKFRSMTDKRDSLDILLPDGDRNTPFGLWFRSTSIDELPQLFNVLIGDMSLIGPRPLIMENLHFYSTSADIKRHDVLPGITGWAQINDRNNITWQKRFALDIWYVENHNMLLDIRILLLTVLKVIKRENITGDTVMTVHQKEV